jgi:hypothetical protein
MSCFDAWLGRVETLADNVGVAPALALAVTL